jgi:acetyl esterase/lipase
MASRTRGSYAARQLVTLALATNAIRPLQGARVAIPAFAAGWLTSELAPQLLAAAAADTGAQLLRRRRRGDKGGGAGLVLGAAAVASLGYLVAGARRSGIHVEGALSESLGKDYLDRLDDAPTAADFAIPFRSIVRPFRLTEPDVEVIRDINYTAGGRRARLDIYRQRGRDLKDAPVLVQIHGGGWTIGTKEQQGLILMNRMAQRGWVCVALNYRLAPKHPFPAQIVDVKKAIAWVREHISSYGGDPDYLVATGGSAGGHLAALAALTPGLKEYQPGFEDADTHVAACVPFYGVYDMAGLTGDRHAVELRDGFLAPRVFRADPKEDRDAFVQASPLAHTRDHPNETPDFFVLHGTNDSLVSVRQARAFVDALKRDTDATVTYAELPGTQHAFEVFSSIRSQHVVRAVQRWLGWHHARWTAERRSAA